jgi:hypothetical protein
MIDLEKLERITDQHSTLHAAAQAIYENYKRRSTAARLHRRDALRRAPGEIQQLTLAQLATYAIEDLQRVNVDVSELQSAQSEDRMARRLFAEHQVKQQETNTSAVLLDRLTAFAGIEYAGLGIKASLKV